MAELDPTHDEVDLAMVARAGGEAEGRDDR
jgi:hypothetical protein